MYVIDYFSTASAASTASAHKCDTIFINMVYLLLFMYIYDTI